MTLKLPARPRAPWWRRWPATTAILAGAASVIAPAAVGAAYLVVVQANQPTPVPVLRIPIDPPQNQDEKGYTLASTPGAPIAAPSLSVTRDSRTRESATTSQSPIVVAQVGEIGPPAATTPAAVAAAPTGPAPTPPPTPTPPAEPEPQQPKTCPPTNDQGWPLVGGGPGAKGETVCEYRDPTQQPTS